MEPAKWILYVEDDPEFSAVMVESLEEVGFKVVVAISVKDAISKMKNQNFMCMVTDIRLGQESGEEVIAYTRDKKAGMMFNVPVIVTSGFLDRSLMDRLKFTILGALVKPFDPEKLIEKIKSINSIK